MGLFALVCFEEGLTQAKITVDFCLRSNHCPIELYQKPGVPQLVDPTAFIRPDEIVLQPKIIPRGIPSVKLDIFMRYAEHS